METDYVQKMMRIRRETQKSVPAQDNYQFTEETKIVKKGMQ